MAKNERQEAWETDYVDKVAFLRELAKTRAEFVKTIQQPPEEDSSGDAAATDDSGGGDGSGAAQQVSGNSNQEITWNFFAAKGFTESAVAAVMGNLNQESKFSTTIVNPASGATGLCQWLGGRLSALRKFAKDSGKEFKDIHIQLEWLWKELNGGDPTTKSILDKRYGGMDNFKKMPLEQAVKAFEASFERSGGSAVSKRIQYAKEFLAKYGTGNASKVAGQVGGGGGGDTNTNFKGSGNQVSIKNGKVIIATGNRSSYFAGRRDKGRASNWSGFQKLDSGLFTLQPQVINRIAPDANACFSLLAKTLISKGIRSKVEVSSGWREKGINGVNNSPHMAGIALDLQTRGAKDALKVADTAWALGFRGVAIGGNIRGGGGFVHVDPGPDVGGWAYSPYPKYKGPSSWGSYR